MNTAVSEEAQERWNSKNPKIQGPKFSVGVLWTNKFKKSINKNQMNSNKPNTKHQTYLTSFV